MTTTNKNLNATRPEDPSKISFAPECFVVDGYEEVYFVGRSALHPGPARFTNRDEAEAFARKCNRTVSVERNQIRRRIKWF